MKQARKKPLGKPVLWTPQDILAMSEVTPTDLKAAEALWRNESPVKYRELISATIEEKTQQ